MDYGPLKMTQKLNKHNIICRWMNNKNGQKFLVNPDKQVWPCCYLANQGYKFKVTGKYNDPDIIAKGSGDITHPVMQSYYENDKELNLSNNSLEEILNHEWFTKTLPESWEGDEPHRLCVVMCSRNLDE